MAVKKNIETVEEINKKDQSDLFKDASPDALREIAQFMGIQEEQIPEDATREQLLELLDKAKRHDISVARAVTHEGKKFDCPPGYMVIKVTPKSSGNEWGPKSKEAFIFAMNGEICVGRRGVTVIISDKFRSCWRDAIRHEYKMDGEYSPSGEPAKPIRYEVPAEDVVEVYHNPDVEAEKRIAQEIIDGAKLYQAEKKAEKLAKAAFYQNLVNR